MRKKVKLIDNYIVVIPREYRVEIYNALCCLYSYLRDNKLSPKRQKILKSLIKDFRAKK